ncbi:MAG: hypothetical protein ABIT76_04350 [Chthoniobacterales bacterium]
MKKLILLLVAFTAMASFASEAKAGLNLSIGLGLPVRVYDRCDYGYRRTYYRPVTYYNDEVRYYRPRTRVVYYDAPVYYSRPRYYRSYGCR